MKKTLYLFSIVALVYSCKKKEQPLTYHTGDVNPTIYVAIGDAGFSGYMNDGLYREGQENSVPALINKQLNLSAGNANYSFIQPLLPETSIGINLNDQSPLIMGYKTDCNNEESLSPVRSASTGDGSIFGNSIYQGNAFNNLSCPNLGILDIQKNGWGNSANSDYNKYYERFASSATSSIVDDAVLQNPTFFSISLGQEDIMRYASTGGTSENMTPSVGPNGIGFEGTLDNLIVLLSSNGAKGSISNIPNVLEFPFFTKVPWNGLNISSEDANSLNQVFEPLGITFSAGDNPFNIEDTSTTYNVRPIEEGELILLSVPLDSIKCYGMGTIVPIPDEYVLTLDEIEAIEASIYAYNVIINEKASLYNLAYVNTNQFYSSLNTGIIYNGISISNEFVTGNAFSLDGKNLSPMGNALIANLFLKSINAKFNANIQLLDVGDYQSILFP